MTGGRRILPTVPRLPGRTYNDIAAELQRFLDALTESEDDGVPAGFKAALPTTITPDSAGSAGAEADGWASASHDHPVSAATPSGLSNSNTEGSATSFLRSDMGLKRDVRVMAAGSDVGTRNALNLVDGSSVDITATDNGGSDRVDITAEVIGRVTTKGDLWTFAAAPARLAVGANALQLTAASGATNGIQWGPVVLTPAQIVANTNDYAPGLANFYRLSSDASRDVTGLVAGTSGESRTAVNVGSQNIVLKHQNVGSALANRFLCAGAADITLAADEIAMLWYDVTTARWRVVKA